MRPKTLRRRIEMLFSGSCADVVRESAQTMDLVRERLLVRAPDNLVYYRVAGLVPPESRPKK